MSDVPNLDAMEAKELAAWRKQRPSVLRAQLFPERKFFEGAAAARTLIAYARDLEFARFHRLRGNIDAALAFERACDETYRALPEWARW